MADTTFTIGAEVSCADGFCGEVTPLSDVDLIVVARLGCREEIWAGRRQGRTNRIVMPRPTARVWTVKGAALLSSAARRARAALSLPGR